MSECCFGESPVQALGQRRYRRSGKTYRQSSTRNFRGDHDYHNLLISDPPDVQRLVLPMLLSCVYFDSMQAYTVISFKPPVHENWGSRPNPTPDRSLHHATLLIVDPRVQLRCVLGGYKIVSDKLLKKFTGERSSPSILSATSP